LVCQIWRLSDEIYPKEGITVKQQQQNNTTHTTVMKYKMNEEQLTSISAIKGKYGWWSLPAEHLVFHQDDVPEHVALLYSGCKTKNQHKRFTRNEAIQLMCAAFVVGCTITFILALIYTRW
jgi:hypothetical protein